MASAAPQPADDSEEKKELEVDQQKEKEFEICSVDDVYNSYVHCSVIFDIRSLDEYCKSHIYDAVHIDMNEDNDDDEICKATKSRRNSVIYGHKDIVKTHLDVIQFVIKQFDPRTLKVFNGGYDALLQRYAFICAEDGCEPYMYPSVIIPDRLYLGRQKTRFVEKALVTDLKVTHIVDVTPQNIPCWQHIKILKIEILDSEDEDIAAYFEQAIEFIDNALSQSEENRVFVHCEQGVSRSSTIVMAWLMKSQKMTLVDAYKLCQKCRPRIHPNEAFFQKLLLFETELFGKSTENEIKRLKLRESAECLVM